MATKMKVIKLAQEARGLALITNRRPSPRPPLLVLMQLRSQAAQTNTPRRRLNVEISTLSAPLQIKINHIRPDKSSVPVLVS